MNVDTHYRHNAWNILQVRMSVFFVFFFMSKVSEYDQFCRTNFLRNGELILNCHINVVNFCQILGDLRIPKNAGIHK